MLMYQKHRESKHINEMSSCTPDYVK